MKFKIKEEKEENEIEVELSLEKVFGSVYVKATASNGSCWNLIHFEDTIFNGKFQRCPNVPINIGIEVDKDGRIIEDK